MAHFYLSFPPSLLIEVTSSANIVLDDKTQILLDAYLPGATRIADPHQIPDISIEHIQSDDKKLTQEGKKIRIYDNWVNEFPLDFYHLLYSILRQEWLKRNLFSVHAACIEKEGYILLVGHTGVGKTSIVLELLKEKNIQLFSGNKTVVTFNNGHIEAIAGTRTITANSADIQQHITNGDTYITYGNRVALSYAKKCTDNPGPIRAIVFVGLNDGVSENNILHPTNALHRLYGFFLDTVNADTIVCDAKAVYVGTPPPGKQEMLAKNLSNALQKIPVYSIKGSMDFISDMIHAI